MQQDIIHNISSNVIINNEPDIISKISSNVIINIRENNGWIRVTVFYDIYFDAFHLFIGFGIYIFFNWIMNIDTYIFFDIGCNFIPYINSHVSGIHVPTDFTPNIISNVGTNIISDIFPYIFHFGFLWCNLLYHPLCLFPCY